jgi:hypothetical protein
MAFRKRVSRQGLFPKDVIERLKAIDVAPPTQPPWFTDSDLAEPLPDIEFIRVRDDRDDTIAFVSQYQRPMTGAANARLISAAPRMLELLRELASDTPIWPVDHVRSVARAILKDIEGA